jgi:hypothetical protein
MPVKPRPDRDPALKNLFARMAWNHEQIVARMNLEFDWEDAIVTGNVSAVDKLLRYHKISPDTPISPCGRSPLIDIANKIDSEEKLEKSWIEIAYLLFLHGVTLNHKDCCGLYPADHALVSGSPGFAIAVVSETLRRNGQFHEGQYHAPNLDEIFITTSAKPEREYLYLNLERNLPAVQAALANAPRQDARIAAWRSLTLPDRTSLPVAGPELTRMEMIFNGLCYSQQNGNLDPSEVESLYKELGELQDRIRLAKMQAVHALWQRCCR